VSSLQVGDAVAVGDACIADVAMPSPSAMQTVHRRRASPICDAQILHSRCRRCTADTDACIADGDGVSLPAMQDSSSRSATDPSPKEIDAITNGDVHRFLSAMETLLSIIERFIASGAGSAQNE
jgi:hypothetical protein